MSSATSLATKKYKVDEEIRPVVESLQQETAKLLELSKEIYVPSKVSDTVIGEVLPVRQQLLLYVVSAHVALSSMFCQKKLANEPIPEKLTQQIVRVQGYLRKLKEHGIDLTKQEDFAVAATKISGSRRDRDDDDNEGGYGRQKKQQTVVSEPEEEQRKRRIDPAIAARVGKLAQQGTKRSDV